MLLGGRAAAAARYPDELCKAMCRGIVNEKKQRIMSLNRVAEVRLPDIGKVPDKEDFHEKEEAQWIQQVSALWAEEGTAYDDVSGMRLDAGKVKVARAQEMAYVKQKKVRNVIT